MIELKQKIEGRGGRHPGAAPVESRQEIEPGGLGRGEEEGGDGGAEMGDEVGELRGEIRVRVRV